MATDTATLIELALDVTKGAEDEENMEVCEVESCGCVVWCGEACRVVVALVVVWCGVA